MDSKQVLQTIQDENISFIDFWFVDIFGELHNVGMPSYAIDENSFVNGLEKLDASSIVGFKSVNNSDMILMPDPNSFKILPNDMIQDIEKMHVYFVIFMMVVQEKNHVIIEILEELHTNQLKNLENSVLLILIGDLK